jgi:hypothetical protein
MRHCQVRVLPEAQLSIRAHEQLRGAVVKLRRSLRSRAANVLSDPGLLWRKAREVLLRAPQAPLAAGHQARHAAPPLGLRPGDRVRVKSLEEIRRTLDARGRCDRLAFMPSAMSKYCGAVFAVHKPVRFFFDERQQRLCRLRDVVILEGVFCEPPLEIPEDWGGCDRTCFLFWKEAWLERVHPE